MIKKIVLKIYLFFFLIPLVVLFKKKAFFIIKKIAANSGNGKFFFHFYKSIDMEIINYLIIKNLQKKFIVKICKIEDLTIQKYVDYDKNINILFFKDFYNKLKETCKKYKILKLYYPIIDSIHNQISILDFKKIIINKKFFEEIVKLKKECSLIAKKYDKLFLSDSAYILNNILKQSFIYQKKEVFTVMSRGNITKHTSYKFNECSVRDKFLDEYLYEYKINKIKIEKYLIKRFNGEEKNILFNASFKNQKSQNIKTNKIKILFINDFFDASNISWSNNQIFCSNFEWLDFSLNIIKNINYNNFYIKFHPTSMFDYKKNKYIKEFLIKKYQIPLDCFNDCPNLKTILINKLPVYTHNGTAVLDTLAFGGYKSFFCGSRYTSRWGFKANSKSEWKNMLLYYNSKKIYTFNHELIQQAKFILWRDFNYRNIPNISPDKFILPWSSSLDKFFIFLNQIKNILFDNYPKNYNKNFKIYTL